MTKEGYLNTNAHLEAKVALLMAQLAESQAREAKLRETLLKARHALEFANDSPNGPICDTIWMMHGPETLFDFLDAAIEAPAEYGALRENIEAARKEERETCAAICDELEQHYSDYKDAALLNGDVALSNAASGEPRAARSIAAAIRGRT